MSRELSVVYGGVTFGESTSRPIHSVIINKRGRRVASIDFTFTISSSTAAAFATEISAVETALRKPYQALTVTQGAATLYSFSQSSNTGMDAEPEVVKREEGASGRSRRYTASIKFNLPANTGAELVTGLAEHTVEVAYDPARIRTITITGEFTAAGGNDARAQFTASIDSLESSVFSALGLVASRRELIEEPTNDSTYNTKSMTFRRVWRELIFSQGGASFEDAAIKRQVLKIDRLNEAPGDTPGASRFMTLTAQYDCWLDNTITTNIISKYQSIRSWLFSQISALSQGGGLAVIDEDPQEILDENRLSVRIVCKARTGSQIIERTLEIMDEFDPGWTLAPVWGQDRFSKYPYQGPATQKRTYTDTKRVLGFVYSLPAEMTDGGLSILTGAGLGIVTMPGGMRAIQRTSQPKYIHRTLGRLGQTIDVTDIVKVDIFEFFKPASSSTAGGVAT